VDSRVLSFCLVLEGGKSRLNGSEGGMNRPFLWCGVAQMSEKPIFASACSISMLVARSVRRHPAQAEGGNEDSMYCATVGTGRDDSGSFSRRCFFPFPDQWIQKNARSYNWCLREATPDRRFTPFEERISMSEKVALPISVYRSRKPMDS